MNNRNLIYGKYLIMVFLLVFSNKVFSGTTGKIVGKVVDKSSGETLPGVNIILDGTTIGTASNIDGEFTILNVSPGHYDVVFMFIGYAKYKVKDVIVNIDRTTKLDVQLVYSTVEISEVVINAKKPPVQKDRTYSSSVVNSKEIKNMPVTEIGEILALQPGVVKSGGTLHFRGGRGREVAYIIDGIPVTNSFNQGGGSNVLVENSMISQLEVITGTFNAEYGSAQSGIVNIVTKNIQRKFSGSASFYSGDYLSNKKNIFLGVDSFSPIAEKDFQLNINAPIIADKLGISVVGRYNISESLNWYEKRFNSLDGWKISAYERWFQEQKGSDVASSQAIYIPDSLRTGDFSMGPLAKYQSATFNVKLNYLPIPEIKLAYQIFGALRTQQGSNASSRTYAPDNIINIRRISQNHFITFRHIPSESFFYSFGFSYQYNTSDSYYRKDNKIASYPGDSGIQLFSSSKDGFSLGSEGGFYTNAPGKNFREQIIVNGEFNWQVDKYNFLKGGFEYKKHKVNTYSWGFTETKDWENKKWINFSPDPNLKFEDYWEIMQSYWKNWDEHFNTTKYRRIREDEYALWRDYTINPYELSAYLQDKVELGEIIINIGLRADMFYPQEKIPKNFKVEASKLGSDINLEKAKNVLHFSPRLGVSFPISPTGVFHAAYGHFVQMPSFEKMFNEPLYVVTPLQLDGKTLGNANLEPEKTIQYELGLQQEIIPGLTMDVSAYNKNTKNLLGVEYVTTIDNVRYKRYINRDYGNSKGLTIGVRYSSGSLFNATVNYTYSTANGSSSNPDNIATIQASTSIGGEPIEFIDRQIISLNWDQTHTFNTVLNFNIQDIANINVIGNVWSGQPFTPSFVEKFDILTREYKNAASKPLQWDVDLKASRPFTFFGLKTNVYLKVDNVFDYLNEQSVYSNTGSAEENVRLPENRLLELERLRQAGLFTLSEIDNRPGWYSSPRKVQLGFEVYF